MADRATQLISKRNITGNGCWEWTGWRNGQGYGEFGTGPKKLVHRFSFEHFIGPIPPRGIICHRCDNPPCFNPDHLFLGNHTINARDSVAKGRNYSSARKTCIRGHEFDGINSNGKRTCSQCEIARKSENRPKLGKPETRTHCINGHPFSGENLYIAPADGRRMCRICKHDVIKRFVARRKAALKSLPTKL